jgi:glycosyltransferase involved in cell wall biosynthesis
MERPEESQLARIADLEREVALWKLRAESAESAIVAWRATQGRSLWRFLVAVDRIRARIAPPRTRRDRVARAAAYRLTNALLRIGRDPAPNEPRERVRPIGQKAVLFVFDDLGGICTRYRCDHQAEQLRFLGVSHDIAHSGEIDLQAAADHYECFVLSRVAWNEDVAAFFDRARALGKTVLFDTDDLIFEPDLDRHFAFLDTATEEERTAWVEEMLTYCETLERCDGAIVTTETLRRFALRRNERVEVVFNAESEELLRLANDALGGEADHVGRRSGSEITIAYLSGTPTHDRDFLEATDALLWTLENYVHTRLLIVGKLELDPRFERFGDRVTKIRKQPWQAVPGILAQVDISLAPLERENPFTESKSCLKYLEAALLGVPTVASPRDDFARAIDHGRNGFLADNRHEWREALRLLVESKDLRRSIGTAAYEDVRRNHTTKARAPLLEQALATLTPQRGADEGLSINWLTGSNVDPLAELLAQSGHDVRVYGEGRYDDLAPADVSIATDLRSAHAVAAHGSSLFKWFLVSTVGEGQASDHLPLRQVWREPLTGPGRLEQLLSTSCFVALAGESRERPRSQESNALVR